MQLFITIASIFATVGGLAYALAVLISRGIGSHLIELTAWIAFDQIRRGREVLWEDLRAIYRRINAFSGFPGEPRPAAAVAVVERLQSLAVAARPAPWWEASLRALRRSAPHGWVVPLAGPMFYPTIIVFMMVLGSAALLRYRLGLIPEKTMKSPGGLIAFFVVVCLIAVICVLAVISQGQRYWHLRRVRRFLAAARSRGAELLALIPEEEG